MQGLSDLLKSFAALSSANFTNFGDGTRTAKPIDEVELLPSGMRKDDPLAADIESLVGSIHDRRIVLSSFG